MLKGEDILTAVERLRRRSRELNADCAYHQSAPFPSEGARAKARQTVEALAMRGAPNVSRMIEHDGNLEFVSKDQSVPIIGGSKESPVFTTAAWSQPDVLALFCWLNRDALIAKLDEEISAEADDKSALSHAERERHAAEVATDLLAIERQEAALVWAGMEQGLPCEHRSDCAPQAILQCRLITVAPRVAAPGSSVDHALDIIGGR